MVSISLKSSLKRDPEQVYSKVDSEVIMLSLNEGKYHALNEVGTRIWELLDQSIEVKSLVSILTKEYDISITVCEEETLELLNELYEKGLIIQC